MRTTSLISSTLRWIRMAWVCAVASNRVQNTGLKLSRRRTCNCRWSIRLPFIRKNNYSTLKTWSIHRTRNKQVSTSVMPECWSPRRNWWAMCFITSLYIRLPFLKTTKGLRLLPLKRRKIGSMTSARRMTPILYLTIMWSTQEAEPKA